MKTINLFSIRARGTGAALVLLAITSLLATAPIAAAASPSELLEQGIYSEETKGDVDAAFAFGMERPAWFDVPGSYHNGGCGFAFADGHSETHRWQTAAGKDRTRSIADPQNQEDWAWMRDRTSARVSGTIP
jgi:prepilin-type processing-associated H-X9-DG protein